MTPIRKQKFAEEYLKCPNAAEAARKAGYSPKSAARIGNKLMKDKEVKKAVKQALEQSKKAAAWNADHAAKQLEENIEFAKQLGKPDSINKSIEILCKLYGIYPAEKQEISFKEKTELSLTYKELCDNGDKE